MAIAFAKAEPETVNLYLDLEEKELLSEGYRFGELCSHREALKMKPFWAVARQWAPAPKGGTTSARRTAAAAPSLRRDSGP